MRLRELPGYARDVVLRMLPRRRPTGLLRVGEPGREAPVLLTGNYALTVRRLLQALRGRDAWVLVANSGGINVWCAAGGGHLTHHDVISVIRTSGIADEVDHRRVVLPQLAATGVERARVAETTGWDVRWGPARLEDLPAYLDRGMKVRRDERAARFPLWERAELSGVWSFWLAAIGALVLGLLFGWPAALAGAAMPVIGCLLLFVVIPWVPVTGWARGLTYLACAAAFFGIGAGVLVAADAMTHGRLVAIGVDSIVLVALLGIDLPGMTPVLPSDVIEQARARIELQEDRCTGKAQCVLVCPREVLAMDGARRKVRIVHPDACIRCGACIVQCPEDALVFRWPDGSVVGPDVIRTTRLNMLGRRRRA